jgi:LPXTG-motif cell wall-anchored protein
VDVPVLVCGNGIGVLGDAAGSCAPGTGGPGTGGPGTGGPGTGGPGVDVDVPVTACGDGIGLLGSGSGSCGTAPGTPGTPSGPEGPGTPVQAVQPLQPVPSRHLGGSVAAASSPRGAGPGTGPGELAYTGVETAAWLLVAALCLLAGLGTVAGARRRDTVALS